MVLAIVANTMLRNSSSRGGGKKSGFHNCGNQLDINDNGSHAF